MALTTAQQTDVLFKKLQGVSETATTRQFFEEPYLGRQAVYPTQIWADYAKIPTTAPGGADGAVTGVVTRYIARSMAAVAGTTNSFYLALLKNTIPFNFGDGSYNYALTDSAGTAIPFGSGDWLVDTDAGTLTFLSSTPANMPPKISFYTYSGTLGAASDAVAETSQTLAEGTTNQNVTGFLFTAGAVPKTVIYEFQVYRISTSTGAVELLHGGRISFQWKPILAAWVQTPLEESGDVDSGVTFNINATGQIRASTNTISGTGPTTTLRSRAKGFAL